MNTSRTNDLPTQSQLLAFLHHWVSHESDPAWEISDTPRSRELDTQQRNRSMTMLRDAGLSEDLAVKVVNRIEHPLPDQHVYLRTPERGEIWFIRNTDFRENSPDDPDAPADANAMAVLAKHNRYLAFHKRRLSADSKSTHRRIITSKIVPTVYDLVYTESGEVILTDDRGRQFHGPYLGAAIKLAEAAQDPHDPIHHPPYPSPEKTPLP